MLIHKEIKKVISSIFLCLLYNSLRELIIHSSKRTLPTSIAISPLHILYLEAKLMTLLCI